MDQMDAQELFQQGLQAVRDEKDLNRGRKLLVQSLRLNPNNDMAWVWLSRATTDPQKRQECLERALTINSNNRQALELQNRLTASSVSSHPAAPVEKKAPAKNPPNGIVTDVSQLGSLLRASGMNPGHLFQRLIWIVVCGFLSFIGFAALFDNKPDGSNQIPFGLMAALPLLGILLLLFQIVMALGTRVEVYEQGLSRVYGGERKSWRWSVFTDMKFMDYSYT
ncbi:MAG TPA: hypothetical protein VHO69_05190 [Phototrophicaceae bacterium]|nr:hypothetical protein [Phototrophicaceae bacterium]